MDTNFIPASTEQRAFNLVIDTIAFYVIWLIVCLILAFSGVGILEYSETTGEEELTLGIILMTPLVYWGYYFLFEFAFQKTLGKLITGTKVVSADDDKPTAKEIMIRTLSRSIPFEWLSFLGSADDGWHDRFSKTKLIKTRGLARVEDRG